MAEMAGCASLSRPTGYGLPKTERWNNPNGGNGGMRFAFPPYGLIGADPGKIKKVGPFFGDYLLAQPQAMIIVR